MNTARIPLLVLAPVLLVSFAPGPTTGSTALSAQRSITTAGTWSFGVISASARRNVLADVATAVPAARRVLNLVDGSITIDGSTTTCPAAGDSCSHPTLPGSARPWQIDLQPGVTWSVFRSSRFVVFHEIGHAVWGLVFSDADRQAFVDAVNRSLAGRQCRGGPDNGPCASMYEMFADEFARWAGGFPLSLSWYQTPPLLSDAAFGRLIGDAIAHSGS